MWIKLGGLVGLSILCALASLAVSCGGSSRPAGILLLISQGARDVTSFGINLNTGVLTQINTAAPVPANSTPSAITLDPTGNFAYVANQANGGGTGTVSAYSVKTNGTLSSVGSNPATGVNPVALAIDHAGHFLFVANQGSNDVSVFSIGSNASLSAVAGSPFPAAPPTIVSAASPGGVAVTPSGAFLYVSDTGQNTVSGFAVNSTSGVLTSVPGFAFAAGSAPSGLAIDPTGKYLYVANQGSNNISAFTICASALPGCTAVDGSLVPVSGSPFSAGLGPVSVAVDPSENFLYAADMTSNQLSGYRINPSTGALTALTTPTDSTGTNPVFVAIHPGGNYLYLANSGSDSISGFRLTTQSGVLSPLAAVSTASRPVGIALK